MVCSVIQITNHLYENNFTLYFFSRQIENYLPYLVVKKRYFQPLRGTNNLKAELLPTSVLNIPQWSLRIQVDRTIVNAGEEKNIAVASPRGKSATA